VSSRKTSRRLIRANACASRSTSRLWFAAITNAVFAAMPRLRAKKTKHRINKRHSRVHMGLTVIMEIRLHKGHINIQVLKQDSTIIRTGRETNISTRVGSIRREAIAGTTSGVRTEGVTAISCFNYYSIDFHFF
jgi:hypothetical protein